MNDLKITKEDGASRGRYVATIEGQEAELTYSRTSPDQIVADHTGVPTGLEGRGIGTALVKAMIEDARENDFRIEPLCPFVEALFRRNPDWADLKA